MGKDKYMCQLCQNHGIFDVPKKGHKQLCPYKNCGCSSCGLNAKRRELDQIERQLRKDDPRPETVPSPYDATPPSLIGTYPQIPQIQLPVSSVTRGGPRTCFNAEKNGMSVSFDCQGDRRSNNLMINSASSGEREREATDYSRITSMLTNSSSVPGPFRSNGNNDLPPMKTKQLHTPKHAILPLVPSFNPASSGYSTHHSLSSPSWRYCPYNASPTVPPRLENFLNWTHARHLMPHLSQAEFKALVENSSSEIKSTNCDTKELTVTSAFREVEKSSSRNTEGMCVNGGHGRAVKNSASAVKRQPSIFRSVELMAKSE